MSVRATGSLISDVVIASGLQNSPQMVVQSVDENAKLVTTIWFSDTNEAQQAVFPAGALDRAEEKKAPAKAAKSAGKKPGAKAKK
ncbi:MAG: hypothetical protein LBT39_02640 [Treponema sp.]|jgi:hypothetical protein|nr:hypothetical protein [Treponema sp.]